MKPGLLRLLLVSLAFTLLSQTHSFATHLRAGEITVRRDACNSLKFWITITVFTNTINTNVLFGGDDDILDFGDGTQMLVPETQNTLRPDLGEGIATASFTISHTYPAGSTYIISYSEPNRNEGVQNMDNSVNTRFYLETQITVDPFFGCNQYTPTLAVPPIDRGCTGVAWFHNPGAFDLDGDSLSYELVVPFRERNTPVVNYKSPIDPKFYANYGTGNEAGSGAPTFNINPVDGTITWDAPGSNGVGEYNIAFVIREWRKVAGKWRTMGFVRRDMQIIIEDCDNERPELDIPEDVCVEAGTTLDATIFGTDPDNHRVKIEAFSEIFNIAQAQSPATYSPKPGPNEFFPSPAQTKFQWKTECSHVKDQPYQVVFKITDNPGPGGGPKLVTFKTWFIRVVGPDPVWKSATPNFSQRSVALEWEKYVCENAERIQVWRRVDSLAFTPDSCQTGMPPNLGYTLIRELPLKTGAGNNVSYTTQFTDTNEGRGLAPGAVYCYRLVALFPAPRGGESYVSQEICIPPILADAPVITNVTVDRTGNTDGQITVRWVPPFDVSPTQFPPPYTYEVYRAEGFTGDANITRIPKADPASLEVVDAGLNTRNQVYNYRIVAKDNTGATIDTSAVASSVRLEAQSELNQIALTWRAEVPWTNQVGLKHRLYRSTTGATLPSELTLLAEIDVIEEGFTFVDKGQVDGVPLEPGKEYCYVVETLGTYGNENPILKAREPFRNFSQIVCAAPGDSIPPCKPLAVVAHEPLDCSQYITQPTCENSIFSNTLKWDRPDIDCGDDVAYYNIYVASTVDGDFSQPLPVQVRDTFFIHQNLPSLALCYRISAVDRSGNESELSDPICFDNCPYYELPNVFTPNNDGENDRFSAYSNRLMPGESEETSSISPENRNKCARFVQRVVFRVFNRWGKEVYQYESGGERTIYIDWDGRADDGSDLATGIYYYVADVTFDAADPAKRNQTLKGWVHLLR